ncbi:hypothetical protein F5148DRAFT_1287117 [Russula earlei]|uniref:Uncharacterized protein n=1 Tax=Russula earlei TaxID=71964 RepID=A0ACC0U2M6_9AGAM|nr:hypothetical protein F5148DRAFT_1287117 [Russula earlei]
MQPIRAILMFALLANCFFFTTCSEKKQLSLAAHNKLVDSCNRLVDRLAQDTTVISDDAIMDSCVALFEANNDYNGEAEIYEIVAQAAQQEGNYARALENWFNCERLWKELKDTTGVVKCKLAMAEVYRVLNDKENCLQNVHEVLALASKERHTAVLTMDVCTNFAYYYEKFSEYDSSLVFLGILADSIRIVKPSAYDSSFYTAYSELIKGNIYLDKYTDTWADTPEQAAVWLDSARRYYTASLTNTKGYSRQSDFSEAYYGIAACELAVHEYETAIRHALQALAFANQATDIELRGRVYRLLVTGYQIADVPRPDSALYYQSQYIAMKDSSIRIQRNIVVNNQHAYVANYYTREEAERKKQLNRLMFMLVPPFIIFFIYVVILLGRMKVKERLVESMSLVATIMIFEFIALLLHGYLDKVTHENPLLLLTALVLVGIALEPLHNYFQNWLKRKVVHEENNKG